MSAYTAYMSDDKLLHIEILIEELVRVLLLFHKKTYTWQRKQAADGDSICGLFFSTFFAMARQAMASGHSKSSRILVLTIGLRQLSLVTLAVRVALLDSRKFGNSAEFLSSAIFYTPHSRTKRGGEQV